MTEKEDGSRSLKIHNVLSTVSIKRNLYLVSEFVTRLHLTFSDIPDGILLTFEPDDAALEAGFPAYIKCELLP